MFLTCPVNVVSRDENVRYYPFLRIRISSGGLRFSNYYRWCYWFRGFAFCVCLLFRIPAFSGGPLRLRNSYNVGLGVGLCSELCLRRYGIE